MNNIIGRFFGGVAESFLELFYPQGLTCDVCGEELESGGTLCLSCQGRLPLVVSPCPSCGCETGGGGLCLGCKNHPKATDICISACNYDVFIQKIIYRYKNGERFLKELLSEKMTEKIALSHLKADIIAFVPVTPKVYRARGYNQSELLARMISKNLMLPVGVSLKKIRETRYQKELSAAQRAENLHRAFTAGSDFTGKKVLLIDDVMTTGSTLSECAKTLKAAGAKEVYGCTFASVPQKVTLDLPLI